MSPTSSKVIGGPGFQDLIFHGLHPQQMIQDPQVHTYRARPRDNSMQICLDLKGAVLTFPVGHVIGQINTRTGEVIQSEEMLTMLGDDMPVAVDEHLKPVNTNYTSMYDLAKGGTYHDDSM